MVTATTIRVADTADAVVLPDLPEEIAVAMFAAEPAGTKVDKEAKLTADRRVRVRSSNRPKLRWGS